MEFPLAFALVYVVSRLLSGFGAMVQLGLTRTVGLNRVPMVFDLNML